MKITAEQADTILKIIQEYLDTDKDISPDADPVADLGLSSFDAVMISDTVKERTGIELDVSRFFGCRKLSDILEADK